MALLPPFLADPPHTGKWRSNLRVPHVTPFAPGSGGGGESGESGDPDPPSFERPIIGQLWPRGALQVVR